MNNDFRCNCPITSALDIVGDKWTLVIIKQMLLEGKKTFKALSQSDEGIASNILSSRLKTLEKLKMISKEKVPHNRKTNIYLLTEKGLSLTPTIVELTLWSDRNIRADHASLTLDPRLNILKANKEEGIQMLVESYKTKNWPSNPPAAT
jgi:DNA-binding HxlR family transcriptional regulator